MTRAEVGFTVTHRRYVPYSHAHYAGNLVDGAYSLAAFGDVATELCIRTDGDEGLFASYSSVEFLAPVRAGDVIEIEARLVRVGTRSREMEFEVRVVGRGAPERGASAADVLDPPVSDRAPCSGWSPGWPSSCPCCPGRASTSAPCRGSRWPPSRPCTSRRCRAWSGTPVAGSPFPATPLPRTCSCR